MLTRSYFRNYQARGKRLHNDHICDSDIRLNKEKRKLIYLGSMNKAEDESVARENKNIV